MTALTADRLLAYRPVTKIQMPVKAATLIYSGSLVFNDAGYIRGGVPTATTLVLGVADGHYDNSGGGAGAINGDISVGECVPMNNGAGGQALANANVGANVYAIDDNTVGVNSAGGTLPVAGKLVRIDGNGMCWVEINGGVQSLLALAGLAPGSRVAFGQHVTASASDAIVTGLNTVAASFAILDDAPVLTCDRAQASLGNQAGAPAAGSILLETFMPTSNANPTPIAATTFGKKVNWVAFGT